jgi:exodeoxyribonuclease VIII
VITDVGLYPNLSRSSYEQIDAINVSRLVHFERSAAHAHENMVHPKAPTKAMIFGTRAHALILEPDRFDTAYVVPPKVDRRTTEGKRTWAEWEAAHPDAECVDADDYAALRGMQAAVWADPFGAELLRGGLNEVCLVWRDEDTGLLCKALLDHLGTFDKWSVIVDLKTMDDVRRRNFTSSVKKLFYGARAAFYLDGCNALAPRERRFVWLAVETEPPHAVKPYEASPEALEAGRSKYRRWLRRYAEAKDAGAWPAYEPGIEELTAEDCEWRSE